MSAHDLRCLAGADTGHVERYYTRWLGENTDPPNSLTVDYLRVAREGKPPYTTDTALALGSDVRARADAGGLDDAGNYGDVEGYVRPSVINEAIAMDLSCARDHKWRLVSMAIERQECNCLNQVRCCYGLRYHDAPFGESAGLLWGAEASDPRAASPCILFYVLWSAHFLFCLTAVNVARPERFTLSLGCTGCGNALEGNWMIWESPASTKSTTAAEISGSSGCTPAPGCACSTRPLAMVMGAWEWG